MEDGEINEEKSLYVYEPSYEWSYDQEGQSMASTSTDSGSSGTVRFIVMRSSILPKKHRVAVIDGYREVQLGRDMALPGSETPRIRLKEMEVSKLHATAYWDQERREWAVVDMGSKHGTFLKSSHSSSSTSVIADEGKGVRLSPPRVASMPRKLRHFDQLTIGGTTFLVHLHDDGHPCIECSLTGDAEVPLFDARQKERREALKKRRREEEALLTESQSVTHTGERDPKKALTILKRSLLSRRDDSDPSPRTSTPATSYVDRSARRRAFHTSSAPDTPGVVAPALATPSSSLSSDPPILAKEFLPAPVLEPVSAPPMPLASTNIGHRLLTKQGWEPGTSLGLPDSEGRGLVEPLELSVSKNRAGLGMLTGESKDGVASTVNNGAGGWRGEAKRRRWESMSAGGDTR